MKSVQPPERLSTAFAEKGLDIEVLEFPDSTRTAQDAAQAIGCEVSDIGKSLVFMGADSGMPVLVIANGADRVDEAKLAGAVGEPIRKADANEVRAATGYAIGGVPPFGHASEIRCFIDEILLAKPVIWVAAGTPKTVFSISPDDLLNASGATSISIR